MYFNFFLNFNIYIANHTFNIGAVVSRKEANTGTKCLMMYEIGYTMIRLFSPILHNLVFKIHTKVVVLKVNLIFTNFIKQAKIYNFSSKG